MQEYPHYYRSEASAGPAGDIVLQSAGLPALRTASPAEFDGPGDRWSPETLLVGALMDCFILTFRAVARASRLSWIDVRCEAGGTLDRVDRVAQFVGFDLRAALRVPAATSEGAARLALEKAERACLIANSLKAPVHLHVDIEVVETQLVSS